MKFIAIRTNKLNFSICMDSLSVVLYNFRMPNFHIFYSFCILFIEYANLFDKFEQAKFLTKNYSFQRAYYVETQFQCISIHL